MEVSTANMSSDYINYDVLKFKSPDQTRPDRKSAMTAMAAIAAMTLMAAMLASICIQISKRKICILAEILEFSKSGCGRIIAH